MMNRAIEVIPEDQILLLEKLQSLLEKQIELVQKGDPGGKKFEDLSVQADVLIEEIKQTGILELAQFRNRKKQLQKLYGCLYLAISAQKDETARQLNLVRKGKKTLVTYRNNI